MFAVFFVPFYFSDPFSVNAPPVAAPLSMFEHVAAVVNSSWSPGDNTDTKQDDMKSSALGIPRSAT